MEAKACRAVGEWQPRVAWLVLEVDSPGTSTRQSGPGPPDAVGESKSVKSAQYTLGESPRPFWELALGVTKSPLTGGGSGEDRYY